MVEKWYNDGRLVNLTKQYFRIVVDEVSTLRERDSIKRLRVLDYDANISNWSRCGSSLPIIKFQTIAASPTGLLKFITWIEGGAQIVCCEDIRL